MKTDKKSKEITAIPALIQMLDLRGAMVTIDAMVWASKHCDDGALSGRTRPPDSSVSLLHQLQSVDSGASIPLSLGDRVILNVSLQEDACQIYRENAAENLAGLQHMALNMMRSEKTG